MAKKHRNEPFKLYKRKHKLTAVTREGSRIKLQYRRYRDNSGRVCHELIGPFDLTDGVHRS